MVSDQHSTQELRERCERLLSLGEQAAQWGPAYETGLKWAKDCLGLIEQYEDLAKERRQCGAAYALAAGERDELKEQLEAIREDCRIAFGTWPVDPTCPLCGDGSAAHYCPPREAARARLGAVGYPADSPKDES